MITHQLDYLLSKKIILASKSPRRAEILNLMGITKYEIKKSSFAEDLQKAAYATPNAYAIATAESKGEDIVSHQDDAVAADMVISADTIVVIDGKILEKPSSEAAAIHMLNQLSGKQHTVITGVCVIVGKGDSKTKKCFSVESNVWFDELCDDLVKAYVKSGEPMDKAGAYGIQGLGSTFIKRIDGCYFNVMGLPAHTLAKCIRQLIDDGEL